MPHELESIRDQMDRLEHQLRWFKIAAVVLAILALAFALAPRSSAQQPDALRVRQLIVEDANGRPRVVLGPLDAGNNRRTGLRINDTNGVERFGVAFMDDGNIVADAKEGAYIRFLDRGTSGASRTLPE